MMNFHPSPRLFYVGIVLNAVVLLAACGDSAPESRTWKEEVSFEDGSKIVVKRSATFRKTDSLGGDGFNNVETSAKLAFTGPLENTPEWSAALRPLLLYRSESSGQWVVVATTTSCDQWNKMGAPRLTYLPGKPNTIYWEFRLADGEWKEHVLSMESLGKMSNLLVEYADIPKSGIVTSEQKERLIRNPKLAPLFVSILKMPDVSCTVDDVRARQRENSDMSGSDRSSRGQ